MANRLRNTYAKNEATQWSIPTYFDGVAFVLVMAIIVALAVGARAMLAHYQLGQVIPISLNPSHLPYYALRTLLRMFLALLCSLLFTFIFGTWAAKSRQAERIIIPMIDILQSVPVLGYLSITLVAFVALFRGSMLGPECAAIFTIFTAQVWNMTLSFYQSVASVPEDMREASRVFQLNAWQTFWRIEVPYAMPGLIWNMMMSMSGSWVFLVASEAISVANKNITLPGIGSYIDLAIQHKDMHAIGFVIVAVFIVIALYDQLFFRPLVAWSEKFKTEEAFDGEEASSWVLDLFQRTAWFRILGAYIMRGADAIVNVRLTHSHKPRVRPQRSRLSELIGSFVFYMVAIAAIGYSCYALYHFIFLSLSFKDALYVIHLSALTTLRIIVVITISAIIWVPLGVWIGMNPKATQIVQPLAQFLAAFPVNLLFPVAALIILKYHLDVNIWCAPLMILGTQWYILFNVIAGAAALPKNLKHAVATLNVTGWLRWRRFILPGIFPYFITGAITAAGGAWNITIIAEAISWGNTHLNAAGIGAYITQVAAVGNFPKLALGIAVMSIYVLIINRLLWRPLYALAQRRFQIR